MRIPVAPKSPMIEPLPVLSIVVAPLPEAEMTFKPGFDTSTRPLVGVPIVRFAPVDVIPVSQELVMVVSSDTSGQVCAWAPTIVARVNPITRVRCFMLNRFMD